MHRTLQSGGKRSCNRNFSLMCGRTSSSCKKKYKQTSLSDLLFYSTFFFKRRPTKQKSVPLSRGIHSLTNSTSFSKNGTSFRSSLSFLSTNQLSIGMPLDSCKRETQSECQIFLKANKNKQTSKSTNLVCKGLRRVVDYYSFGQISPKYVKVFDVVSLDAHAVLAKQPVPNHKHNNDTQ